MYYAKLKSIGIVSLGTFLGIVLSIISQAIIASYFGAGKITDAYFMATSIAAFFGKMLLLGQLSSVFMPIFLEYYTKDRISIWKLSSNLINIVLITSGVVFILCFIFSGAIVNFFAPGFDEYRRSQTILLFRIILPAELLLLLSSATLATILNALKKFTIPVIIQLMNKIITIILLLIFGKRFGIISLAWIVFMDALIGFTLLYIGNLRIGFKYNWIVSFKDGLFKRLFKLWYPYVYNNIAALCSQTVYKIVVSKLSVGLFSALSYSERIYMLLSQMTNNAVNLVSLQEFSQDTADNSYSKLGESLKNSIRILGLISIPITFFLITFSSLIIKILYGRGAFIKDGGISPTSSALIFFAISLFPFGCYQLFFSSGFALKDTKFIVKLSIFTEIVRMTLYYLLPQFFSFIGLILSGIISYIIAIFFYLNRLKRNWEIENLRKIYFNSFFGKIFLTILCLIILSLIGKFLVDFIFPRDTLFILTGKFIFLGSLWFSLLFLLSLKVFKLEESRLVWNFIKNRVFFIWKDL